MLFVDGDTIDDVAAIYAVHRVTAWRWVLEARRQLARVTAEILRRELPQDEMGAESLLAWVKSQVELSLSDVLAPE
jgi:RNA polymerase sigma-70 factor (ECF subfamily)